MPQEQKHSWLADKFHHAKGNLFYDLFSRFGIPVLLAGFSFVFGKVSQMNAREIISGAGMVIGLLWGLIAVIKAVKNRSKPKKKKENFEQSYDFQIKRACVLRGRGKAEFLIEYCKSGARAAIDVVIRIVICKPSSEAVAMKDLKSPNALQPGVVHQVKFETKIKKKDSLIMVVAFQFSEAGSPKRMEQDFWFKIPNDSGELPFAESREVEPIIEAVTKPESIKPPSPTPDMAT